MNDDRPRGAGTGCRWPAPVRGRGFSLIELMIAVAVVAVLVAIALPSYASYMRRSARSEAQSALTDLAARQAQFLVDRRAYATTLAQLNYTPSATVATKYNVAVAVNAGLPPTFTITATALGDQARDTCPTLTVDSAGGRTPAACW